MNILEAEGLVKSFGRRRVVDGVNLFVRQGEIVGLLGPNGAGKTTCFRMICGMLEPDAGTVFLSGLEVTSWPMYRRAREGGMGYLAQESSVFKKLTVEQNLLCMLELLGVRSRARKERCQELLEQFNIQHIRKSRAARLSGGERRRLEIARCLVSEPEIIMLDEPFAGIDPVTVQGIQSIICDLQDQGISILITDHAAREILQIVDRCYVIASGKVLREGRATRSRTTRKYGAATWVTSTRRLPAPLPRTCMFRTPSRKSGGRNSFPPHRACRSEPRSPWLCEIHYKLPWDLARSVAGIFGAPRKTSLNETPYSLGAHGGTETRRFPWSSSLLLSKLETVSPRRPSSTRKMV